MMPSFKTAEIVRQGIAKDMIKQFAQWWGVVDSTVRSWRTGANRNPLDQAARYIRKVHPHNPGNARLAASYFAELVDELDRSARRGVEIEVSGGGDLCEELAQVVTEHADVVTLLVRGQGDEGTLRQALIEAAELRAAVERLTGCLQRNLQSATQVLQGVGAATARRPITGGQSRIGHSSCDSACATSVSRRGQHA